MLRGILQPANGEDRPTRRVARSEHGDELVETRTYLVMDGKPVPLDKKVSLPFEFNGAFSRIAGIFFGPERFLCYSFTLLPASAADGSLQLTFVTSPNLPPACPNHGAAVSGLVRLDPTTAQIRHLERTLLAPPTGGEHYVSFVAIDYAPIQFGTESLWLPTVLSAEYDRGKGRFLAHYSAYHRYTGSSRLLPVDGPPETTPEVVKPAAPHR